MLDRGDCWLNSSVVIKSSITDKRQRLWALADARVWRKRYRNKSERRKEAEVEKDGGRGQARARNYAAVVSRQEAAAIVN